MRSCVVCLGRGLRAARPVSVARVSRAGTTAPTMLLGRKTVGAQARRVNQVVRKMADAAAETGGLQGAIATYEGWWRSRC